MNEERQIRYVSRQELDEAKWNACINRADNGLIYAYSFYLDKMASHWDALVLNDYAAVMPLTWRKKWTIHYLYQPFLTAQLGLFGNRITPAQLAAFLRAIPAKFRLWEFPLNHQNLFPLPDFSLHQRMNYVLPLQKPYAEIKSLYRENIRRNIKKSIGYGCMVKQDIPVEEIFKLAQPRSNDVPQQDLDAFAQLFSLLKKKAMAKSLGILSKSGDLLASAVFLFSHNRAYYILVGNHPNGRTLGASHALIDAFIREHAGQNLLLDFEGSDIRNLAFFYSSFGAHEERYAAIHLNRLPWWIRWTK